MGTSLQEVDEKITALQYSAQGVGVRFMMPSDAAPYFLGDNADAFNDRLVVLLRQRSKFTGPFKGAPAEEMVGMMDMLTLIMGTDRDMRRMYQKTAKNVKKATRAVMVQGPSQELLAKRKLLRMGVSSMAAIEGLIKQYTPEKIMQTPLEGCSVRGIRDQLDVFKPLPPKMLGPDKLKMLWDMKFSQSDLFTPCMRKVHGICSNEFEKFAAVPSSFLTLHLTKSHSLLSQLQSTMAAHMGAQMNNEMDSLIVLRMFRSGTLLEDIQYLYMECTPEKIKPKDFPLYYLQALFSSPHYTQYEIMCAYLKDTADTTIASPNDLLTMDVDLSMKLCMAFDDAKRENVMALCLEIVVFYKITFFHSVGCLLTFYGGLLELREIPPENWSKDLVYEMLV